jgi:hypothetical protein
VTRNYCNTKISPKKVGFWSNIFAKVGREISKVESLETLAALGFAGFL